MKKEREKEMREKEEKKEERKATIGQERQTGDYIHRKCVLAEGYGNAKRSLTSGVGNQVRPPEGEVSELKPEKLVGINQVRGWRRAFTKASK